jgi:hypothetical protein
MIDDKIKEGKSPEQILKEMSNNGEDDDSPIGLTTEEREQMENLAKSDMAFLKQKYTDFNKREETDKTDIDPKVKYKK